MSEQQLANQVVLVTGASRGIGKAIALALGKAGGYIVGTATSEKGAEQITAYLHEAGIAGEGKMLDVRDAVAVNDLVDTISSERGSIGVLVNNAGITRDSLLMRMKDDEWDDIINTNLSSVYRVSKACLRGMMKVRKGRIINIASVVGSMGNVGQTNYAAAKAGIMGFSRSLAREVGSRNITVNTVAPGFIDTDMTRALSEEQRAQLVKEIPLGRMGDAEDIAEAVLFLASPAAGYISGQILHVNGGMYMI
ncbi:MAG: 3-oxoacyl-ACP reductase FabG [Gammaproteobacteria bacterium]|nr:3-oxoacyl-ACP reductase FabG [Gammaproteobacteria bacterium]